MGKRLFLPRILVIMICRARMRERVWGLAMMFSMIDRFRLAVFGAALSAVLASAAPVGAQDMQALMDRLQRLERDIQALNIQIARGASSAPAAPGVSSSSGGTADAYTRMNALEEETRALTGTLEGINHRIQELNQRLDKVMGDIEFRLGALEKGRGGMPSATAAPSPGPVEPARPQAGAELLKPPPGVAQGGAASPAGAVLPPGSVKDQYDYAFGLLRQANYDRAELAWSEFLKAHSGDPLAGNARYWLGETHYVRGNYLKAAEIFAENYKQDPKGSKAPDTLLKLGMSLAQLDRGAQACVTFSELGKKFPKAPEGIRGPMERERKRLACK
ncbi:MAG: tol-pal system protein YbgF [Alphaproteobacteria bacterium]|nr:tol-pal system protein YbgF [Alphaproteobacteria bacterium]